MQRVEETDHDYYIYPEASDPADVCTICRSDHLINHGRNEQDIGERDRRYNTEVQCLRSEAAQLSARLQTSKADQADKQSQLSLLETRLNEIDAERRILEHKLTHSVQETKELAKPAAPSLKTAADGQTRQMKALKHNLERAAELKAKAPKSGKRRSASGPDSAA